MDSISLRWSKDRHLPLRIPAEWQVVAQSDIQPLEPIQDLPTAINAGLQKPIGSPPLGELVDRDSTIALVMDDSTRPTPINRLAPLILDVLIDAGARLENITGLFALGTHGMMSRDEMEARAGSYVFSRIDCRCFHCRDASAFVHLGQTRRHTPVRLNKIVVQANLRILVGTIEPHPQAGFGGGFKNLLPGLAGAATIGRNHLLVPSPDRYNMIGTHSMENPMRLDLEEAGRMVEGPTFIVNVVLDHELEPVAAFCGDAIKAHREGVRVSRQVYGITVPRRADVVIASAFPMEQMLRQGGKAILNVAGACRPGGVVVGFLRCQEGLGEVALPPFPIPVGLGRRLVTAIGGDGIAFLSRHIPGPAPEGRFVINFALQLLKDYHVLIFSPRLKKAYENRFPPILYEYHGELFKRVAQLTSSPAPQVAVFQQGGVSFPQVSRADG